MFRFALISGLCLAGGVVLAADPETDLHEVVVTASLREQSLLDTPASVSVLDAQVLSEPGRQHFEDVLALVPNLHWAGGTSRPRYFQMRGIGEREQYEGAPNPSVGFLIDDIDFSGIGMPATLFDLGRIEVLRGPQGTRYGANALAGLIVLRGEDPQDVYGHVLEAGVGEFGMQSAGFAVTGPVEALSSSWRLSLHRQRSDGFMHNAYLNRDTNDRDELTGRAKWRWEPSAGTRVDFTVLHADLQNGYDAWAIDNSRTTLSDRPGEDSQKATGASARLTSSDWLSNTLTVIASYADSESVNSFDADWGNSQSWGDYTYDYFQRSDRNRETASLEARLASDAIANPGDVSWLFGVYGLRLDEAGRDTLWGVYEDPADPSMNGTSDDELTSRYEATNLAVFGQVDHYFAEHWRWSAGLRFEQREAEYRDRAISGGSLAGLTELEDRDRMLGGQVSLSRDLNEHATAYVSLSRGYKAGGFNLGAVPDEARKFDPEYLWSAESGVKAEVFGGRGYVDAAVFYQWRKDLQVRSGRQADPANPGTYVFVTDNLSSGYNAGVEASLRYALTPSLTFGGSLGLLRTRSSGGITEEGVAVDSREQAHAPEYTASLFVDWRHASGFAARIDVNARDNFYYDVPTDHDMRSHAYALANLKLGYERDRWSAFLWMKNVFDERYPIRAFYFYNEPPFLEKSLYTQLGEPRQVGFTVRFSM